MATTPTTVHLTVAVNHDVCQASRDSAASTTTDNTAPRTRQYPITRCGSRCRSPTRSPGSGPSPGSLGTAAPSLVTAQAYVRAPARAPEHRIDHFAYGIRVFPLRPRVDHASLGQTYQSYELILRQNDVESGMINIS